MAITFPGYLEYSDWLFLGRDFTVPTITMERGRLHIFRSLPVSLPRNSNRETKPQKLQKL